MLHLFFFSMKRMNLREHSDFDILFMQVKAQAPWVLKLAVPEHKRGEYLRRTADAIFGVSHIQDPKGWASALAKSFKPKHQDLFQNLVQQSGIVTKIQESLLSRLSSYIHKHILFAFCQSQFSFSQYKTFRKCLFFDSKEVSNEFGVFANVVKKLLPSKQTLSTQFHRIFQLHVKKEDHKIIYDPKTQKILGHQWNLDAILNLIYSNINLYDLLSDPVNPVLIHRADAFPCGGESCFLAAVTLANFGPYANSLLLNFIGNMAYSSDKVFEKVIESWDSNLSTIQQIQSEQERYIEVLDEVLPCKNKFSFDESFARNFLGLNGSSGMFLCFKCYRLRNYDIFQENIPRVTSFLTEQTLKQNLGGHIRNPMVLGVNPEEDIGNCITHACMAFGRILVKYTYSTSINQGIPLGNSQIFFEEVLGVGKIDLEHPPERGFLFFAIFSHLILGTWSIKACQAVKIMKHFNILAELIKRKDLIPVVDNCYRVLKILYTSDYQPESIDWIWLKQNIEPVVVKFEQVFVLGSECNYPHMMAEHTLKFIEANHSLRLFSNTILETLNSSMKQHFLNRTSRKDFLWEAFQRHIMRLLSAIDDKNKLMFALLLTKDEVSAVLES